MLYESVKNIINLRVHIKSMHMSYVTNIKLFYN